MEPGVGPRRGGETASCPLADNGRRVQEASRRESRKEQSALYLGSGQEQTDKPAVPEVTSPSWARPPQGWAAGKSCPLVCLARAVPALLATHAPPVPA